MIELIAGVIVLILAIIGIAKLATSRRVNVEDAIKTASEWKKTLLKGLYGDRESLKKAFGRAGSVVAVSKSAISAIYKGAQLTREKIDAALKKYTIPLQNAADYLDDIPAIAGTVREAYELLMLGKMNFEEFRNTVLGELGDLYSINKRHYALRKAAMA